MCALLHQIIVQSGPKLQELAAEAYKKSGVRLAESFTALWDLLLQLSREAEASEIVCILDALDKCEKSGQDLLINSLNALYTSPKKTEGRLKILVTSRPYQSIRNRFDGQIIRMAGEDESDLIKQEIDLVIKDKVPQVGSRLNLDTKVQNLLQQKLLDAENRTYLWIYLILEDILERGARVNTTRKMERFLTELPTSIYTAYDYMLKRSPKSDKAKKLLHIILAAVRPLNLREMNMALNIQYGDKSREDVDLDPEDKFSTTIRDTCGLFITVSNIDSTIYFIHQTAKEFLTSRENVFQAPPQNDRLHDTWQHSIKLEDSNHLLTQICFHYLSFSAFEEKPLRMPPDMEHKSFGKRYLGVIMIDKHKYNHELLDYIAEHWHDHFRLARTDPQQRQFWLLICSTNTWTFKLWFGIYWNQMNPWSLGYDPGLTPLMLASMFGHTTVVEFLANENDLEKKDSSGRTALWWAVRGNHHRVLGQLLEKGASVNSVDHVCGTPLVAATVWGDRKMMQTLIEHHALVDGASASGSMKTSPLFYAILDSKSQQECISRLDLLISNGANIHSNHDTILEEAVEQQMFDVARWLISNGATNQLFSKRATHLPSLKRLRTLYDFAKTYGTQSIWDALTDRVINQLLSNRAAYDLSLGQVPLLYVLAERYSAQALMDKLIDRARNQLFSNRAAFDLTLEQFVELYTIAESHGAQDFMDGLLDTTTSMSTTYDSSLKQSMRFYTLAKA